MERKTYFSCLMCPINVEIGVTRCLVIRGKYRPGHDKKKTRFNALRKVDLTGEEHVTCKYAASLWARLSVHKIIFNDFLMCACI